MSMDLDVQTVFAAGLASEDQAMVRDGSNVDKLLFSPHYTQDDGDESVGAIRASTAQDARQVAVGHYDYM